MQGQTATAGKDGIPLVDFSLVLEELVWRFLLGLQRLYPVLMALLYLAYTISGIRKAVYYSTQCRRLHNNSSYTWTRDWCSISDLAFHLSVTPEQSLSDLSRGTKCPKASFQHPTWRRIHLTVRLRRCLGGLGPWRFLLLHLTGPMS